MHSTKPCSVKTLNCSLYRKIPHCSLFIVHIDILLENTFAKCKVDKTLRFQMPVSRNSAKSLQKYRNTTNTNTRISQTQIQKYHKDKYAPKNKIASLASHIESMLSQSSKKFAKWRCYDAVFLKHQPCQDAVVLNISKPWNQMFELKTSHHILILF